MMIHKEVDYKKDDGKWQVLASKYLIRRPWLTARRDVVRLPNGTEIPEFYVLEYPDWVNIIAVTADVEFVMIRQYRHGIDQTRYELVAGCVDPGEDPLTAAKRELYEETGFGGGEWRNCYPRRTAWAALHVGGKRSRCDDYRKCGA